MYQFVGRDAEGDICVMDTENLGSFFFGENLSYKYIMLLNEEEPSKADPRNYPEFFPVTYLLPAGYIK